MGNNGFVAQRANRTTKIYDLTIAISSDHPARIQVGRVSVYPPKTLRKYCVKREDWVIVLNVISIIVINL